MGENKKRGKKKCKFLAGSSGMCEYDSKISRKKPYELRSS